MFHLFQYAFMGFPWKPQSSRTRFWRPKAGNGMDGCLRYLTRIQVLWAVSGYEVIKQFLIFVVSKKHEEMKTVEDYDQLFHYVYINFVLPHAFFPPKATAGLNQQQFIFMLHPARRCFQANLSFRTSFLVMFVFECCSQCYHASGNWCQLQPRSRFHCWGW